MLPAADTPTERLWVWRLGYRPVRALALFLCPEEVHGFAHVPRSGAYIVVANHLSWLDPPWVAFALRAPVRYMAKREVLDVPFVGGLARAVGAFPVRRGQSDRAAMVMALRVLAAGQPLGFFPEGHRSPDGALLRAHPGIALLARRSGAPLLPVAVSGTDRARLGRFWRRDVRIDIGVPFRAADLAEAGSEAQEVADGIMRRVAALLPPERRGAYA